MKEKMNKCIQKNKWGDSFDYLTNYEFDELIEHAETCSEHNALLNDYESSIIPILRAALPEKNINYYAKPVNRNIFSTEFNKMLLYISTFIHNRVLKPQYLVNSVIFKDDVTVTKVPFSITLRLNFAVLLFATTILALGASLWFITPDTAKNSEVLISSEAEQSKMSQPKYPANSNSAIAESGVIPTPGINLTPRKPKYPVNMPKGKVSVQFGELSVSADVKTKPDQDSEPGNLKGANEFFKKTDVTSNDNGLVKYYLVLSNLSEDELKVTVCSMRSKENPNDVKVFTAESGCIWDLKKNKDYVLKVETPNYEMLEEPVSISEAFSQKYIVIMTPKITIPK
jgi:hypothetical protein